MESVVVSAVALDRNEGKVTVVSVPDVPGTVAGIFETLLPAGIVVDMIVQNVSHDGHTDVSFTVPEADLAPRREAAARSRRRRGHRLGHLQGVVGRALGMRSHAGVAAKMFRILADEGINIDMVTTSTIKISVALAGALRRARAAGAARRVRAVGCRLAGRRVTPAREVQGVRGRGLRLAVLVALAGHRRWRRCESRTPPVGPGGLVTAAIVVDGRLFVRRGARCDDPRGGCPDLVADRPRARGSRAPIARCASDPELIARAESLPVDVNTADGAMRLQTPARASVRCSQQRIVRRPPVCERGRAPVASRASGPPPLRRIVGSSPHRVGGT